MKTVLIVEDERVLREGLTNAIVGRLGNEYEVVPCKDGACAIQELAKREKVDLVFLDLSLPYVGGEEVLQYLAESKIDVPVYLLSNKDYMSFYEEKYSTHVKKFLKKAETPLDEIVEIVKNT